MPKKSVKKSVKKTVKKAVKKVVHNNNLGRPKGSGKYGGCETKLIRVPIHLEDEIREFALRKIRATKPAK
ncbi:MAG: hypothetical protein LBQ50_03255 [Planctomycetaceae bacterium]|jgi:hypothetical protein|nr:hypothetical protein [Planctomycetaceae bacterium]